ncbi:MAG TPA: hypothetical protein VET66_04995 [Steroidobacteraceae bacterium]|nr:hypothetical protein [Steroidobacteraceae bacterium]
MKHSNLAAAVAAVLAAVSASRTLAGPQEDLAACGAIQDAAQRLACYDRLAGRPAAAAPAAPAKATVPALPAAGAPAAAAAAAAPAPAAPLAPAAAPARTQAPADARSFGSYSAEHPAAPAVPQTLTVQVTALGKTLDGKPTVTLEGGALWLLDEVDPLLAVGDTVTISRGVLGSFLLRTQSKRLHHVQRIR